MNESKFTFFKQSGWLVIATGTCGVFLMGVYPVFKRVPTAELGIYFSLLRVFTVLGIATVGLQIIMAQDAAAAITSEKREQLEATVQSVARGIGGLWALLAILCAIFHQQIAATLKVSNEAALWVTLFLVLAQLFLPFGQGLLQGAQNFAWLGWSIILNGVGRFAGIAIMVLMLKSHSTGALFGALLGLLAAAIIALWPSRELFTKARSGFKWTPWLRRVLPLTGGTGATLFLMNADVIFVQSHFAENIAPLYSAVATIGVGLVTFTAPMASVMFPKLVRSSVQATRSDSLRLALTGTAVLGGIGAAICTFWPSLPLRIMFFNRPDLWPSAQLVPWFMWAMLPVTVANVLISNLLAKQRFKAVPWFVLLAVGYGLALSSYLRGMGNMEHFAAFKGVIFRLGIFSSLLLIVAASFTVLDRGKSI
jgi:O-antigen/teichoic acid export membrane protein